MTTWRRATADDVVALRDLERIASQTGLARVFGQLPYPDDDVLARWALLLEDPTVVVEVVEDAAGLVALTAHDGSTLRHLAVRPDHWSAGLGRQETLDAFRGSGPSNGQNDAIREADVREFHVDG